MRLITLALLSCAALWGQDICTYDEWPVGCGSSDPKVCDDLEAARQARIAEACGMSLGTNPPNTWPNYPTVRCGDLSDNTIFSYCADQAHTTESTNHTTEPEKGFIVEGGSISPGPIYTFQVSPELPTCDGIEIRYKVEWAQQVMDGNFGPLWRGLDAIYWEKKRAVTFAKRLVAFGERDFRAVRVWELREVRLDCEPTTP